ncbi:toll/interleukin-1 receptor domain-containing protein [Paraburkholderia caledonica]|uniref:toll/interleukin-1 receptor domain-containing protein n=1 Tax=Paraburkholderia caledonica TaxID=134536 RepID=UPI000DEFFBE5|nr:toll/interleukin-1 receptor domain-containing protein [Paraburkholderia caledonica]AXF14805.1 hypothetical protein CUJ87_10590 [Paraburkholderia caledonica]
MKVFISWSKEPSKAIAEELRHMLSAFVPGCEPWMSDHDLQPGQQWNAQLTAELVDSKIALICVTTINRTEPWLNFEAGAISNSLGGAFVHPVLFDVDASDIPSTLSQFQVTKFEEKRFFLLIRSLNRLLPQPEGEHDLRQRFDRLWPALQSAIGAHLQNHVPSPAKKVESKTLANDGGPSEEAKVVLKAIALNENATLDDLVRITKLHRVRAEHHLDALLDAKLIRGIYNLVQPARYALADAGRALAVAQNWV